MAIISRDIAIDSDLGAELWLLVAPIRMKWIKHSTGSVVGREFVRDDPKDMGYYDVTFWRTASTEQSVMSTGFKTNVQATIRINCMQQPDLKEVKIEDFFEDEDSTRWFVKKKRDACREFNILTLFVEVAD